jgi:putative MATE family efflux protein
VQPSNHRRKTRRDPVPPTVIPDPAAPDRRRRSNDLTTAPIPQLIRRITIPVSIGLFFNTMYNVVDTYFGGLISTTALAAMSLSLPVFFIIISIGSGIATGATALIGNALGGENPGTARRFAFQGIAFGVLISVALAFIGKASAPLLFRLLGADEAYLSICLTYMDILFNGTVFFILIQMLNAVLNAVGNTRIYRNFLIAGFFLNVLLDPWFIFGGWGVPAMGVAGIALATVLVQVTGCVYLGIHVRRTGLLDGGTIRELLPRAAPFAEIARHGFPAGLNILTIAIGVFVITYFISGFGQTAVAAYGVGMRVEQILLLPAIGLNTATLTLIAQNHGARRFDRIRETLRKCLTYGTVTASCGGITLFLLAERFMTLFSKDPDVVAVGTTYLKIEALVLTAYVILFVCVAALQGIKQPMFAVVIGLFRQIVAPFAVFYTLTRIQDVGLLGIWWGICAITWTAAAIAFVYARRRIDAIMPE